MQKSIIQIENITFEDLRQMIEQSLYTALKGQEKPIETRPERLTRLETMKEFKLSENKLWRYMRSGRLNYERVGRSVFFNRSDVENLFKSSKELLVN